MYKIGSIVVYGTEGLCKICDITKRTFGKETTEYYVLRPLSNEAETVFVPKNNEKVLSRMRPVLTKEKAEELLEAPPSDYGEWIPDDRERQQYYKQILLCGSGEDILKMTRALYLHQVKLLEKKKKLHAADERFLKEAEKMLFEELAYVFGITVEEVLPLIIKRKEKTAAKQAE